MHTELSYEHIILKRSKVINGQESGCILWGLLTWERGREVQNHLKWVPRKKMYMTTAFLRHLATPAGGWAAPPSHCPLHECMDVQTMAFRHPCTWSSLLPIIKTAKRFPRKGSGSIRSEGRGLVWKFCQHQGLESIGFFSSSLFFFKEQILFFSFF